MAQEASPLKWSHNKPSPCTDSRTGFVTSTRDTSRDFAHKNLFEWVDEEKLFDRETYRRSDRRVQGDAEEGVGQSPDQHILPHLLLPKCAQGHSSRIPDAFHALLDNYEMDVMEDEEVTWEERKENWDFLRAIMKTEVMKEAHAFLISKGQAPSEEDDFTRMLHDIWFRLFRRKGGRGQNSCSFEHVFVGEGRGDEFIGLHNWIQFYLQEKAGNIDYHGFFRRETVRDDEIIRLIAVQFDWCGTKSKPMCSCFIGSSPEFEIAAYTICLLLDRDGRTDCQIGEYEVELTVHSFGRQRKLGSAFMSASQLR
ncbi:poly(U)-specific endoribonuclease-A-like isoform X2 [Babylonia areolata]|uniref:poly(U)-specific endoribonuclease-A-like isoform X2 n=1 Tax=Babylonia areolata TaxID=304850 RepID=UPI003FD51C17